MQDGKEKIKATEARQREEVVRSQFQEQLSHYTNDKRLTATSKVISFVSNWIENDSSAARDGVPFRICEFGGADGILLAKLYERLGKKVELYNAELLETYREKQASPEIHFIPASILNPKFEKNFLDVAIARNVLHHLVDTDLSKTRLNQTFAIRQLFSPVRPGGLVIIEEHINPCLMCCNMFFYLSRLASKLKLRIKAFEVTPHTIVAFVTKTMLLEMMENAKPEGSAVLAVDFQPQKLALQWRLTSLRRNSGLFLVAARK